MIRMLGRLTLSQKSLRLFSFLLTFFFPFSFIYFHHSIFLLTYPLFWSISLLLIPSRVLLVSVTWLIHVNVWQKPLQYCKVISLQLTTTTKISYCLFIIDWLFYISPMSLFNISCIFSVLV